MPLSLLLRLFLAYFPYSLTSFLLSSFVLFIFGLVVCCHVEIRWYFLWFIYTFFWFSLLLFFHCLLCLIFSSLSSDVYPLLLLFSFWLICLVFIFHISSLYLYIYISPSPSFSASLSLSLYVSSFLYLFFSISSSFSSRFYTLSPPCLMFRLTTEPFLSSSPLISPSFSPHLPHLLRLSLSLPGLHSADCYSATWWESHLKRLPKRNSLNRFGRRRNRDMTLRAKT